ncbi:T-complex 10 C-terminal domain-containing protein [Hymenobacter koreensis]|uniref:Centromere protein J C-terminal domain-containing protein n=1 Tax=Hymenobacter koreensis TaxID=1084523 RepID=A0ABP8JLJ3_9BACT
MKNTLLLFPLAAAIALTSCSQDKSAAVDAATTPAADTAVVVDDDADMTVYQDEANRTADMVNADLGLTDTAQTRRVRTVYYTRARRLGELETRYASDTTGRYTAVRQVDTDTDNEIRTVINDDARYRTYQTNRARYYGYNDAEEASEVDARATASGTTPRRRGPAIVKYKKDASGTKVEYANGTVVKVDKDGDRKIEYPNGTKVKRDADDGTRKVKD